jgi:DNA-binding SARP family transcriptional activator
VVELEVLGPLVVWAGGRQLRLGPALRVLLLCLLCADGEVVLAGRLAGLLSETGSPGGSPATLRSHVSHLRRAISDATGQGRDDSDSVIVTDRVGGATAYALRLDANKVDASRFVRDVDRGIGELQAGDAEQAAETLRAAARRVSAAGPAPGGCGRALLCPGRDQALARHLPCGARRAR